MSAPRPPSLERTAPVPAPASARAPWWTVAAFLLLIAAPAPWNRVAAVALIAGGLAPALGRRIARRRAADRSPIGGGVVLGRDRSGRPVVIEERQLATHGIVLGASGAGKSTTLGHIVGDRIARGLPVVVLDLKGSPAFARQIAGAAAQAGRPCVVFGLDGGGHWNPLRHGNPTELKDKLIATERFSEPHYRRAAERYLQTALTVLAARGPGAEPTLAEVVRLCEPRHLVALARRLPEPLRERVADYAAGLGSDQLSAVRGLGTRLAIVTESHLGARLAPGAPGSPELDLRAALRGEVVAVLSLNASSYGSLAAQLGTMAVQDLVSAAGARMNTGPAAPALVAIDEFSALGAEQVLALFARGREAGVSVLLATQELTDLDRAARGLRDQVLGNTALKIAHRQDVPASARAVAELIGTELVWEESRHFGGRGALLARGTLRQVQRFRIHPDAIASLPTGTAVMITKVPRTRVQVLQVSPPRAVPRAASTAPAGAIPSSAAPAVAPPRKPRVASRAAEAARPPPPPGRASRLPRDGPARG